MSLINDALKRARHAQQKRPPPGTSSPALRPAEPVRRSRTGPGILTALVLVALVVTGGVFVWFAMRASVAPSLPPIVAKADLTPRPAMIAREPTPKPPVAKPVILPVASALPDNAPRAKSPEPLAQFRSSEVAATVLSPTYPAPVMASAQVTTAVSTQLIAAAAEPPSPPPLPKLQGIFYRPDRPAALLNGKTVLIGSTSGEYSIVAIGQQSVTVVRAGKTYVLNMPD